MRFPFTIAFSASSLRYHCEFPDVPEMSQYEFDTKEEVGALGRDKLLYTLEYAYRRQGRVIPLPSAVGEDYYFYVLLPYQAKILLWNRLLETGGNARSSHVTLAALVKNYSASWTSRNRLVWKKLRKSYLSWIALSSSPA